MNSVYLQITIGKYQGTEDEIIHWEWTLGPFTNDTEAQSYEQRIRRAYEQRMWTAGTELWFRYRADHEVPDGADVALPADTDQHLTDAHQNQRQALCS